MLCPVCKDIPLVMTERQSIEIDYCPQCRGVWLDRGELDKIIERSEREMVPAMPAQPVQVASPQAPTPYPSSPPYGYAENQFGHGGGRHGGGHHGSANGGFLKRLFD